MFCVPLQTMQTFQKISFDLEENGYVEKTVLHWIPDVLACCTYHKKLVCSPGQEKISTAEVRDLDNPRTLLLFIVILNNIENVVILIIYTQQFREYWDVVEEISLVEYCAGMPKVYCGTGSRTEPCTQQFPPFAQQSKTHHAPS